MMVRLLTSVVHDGVSLAAGTEFFMRDAKAFQLIQSSAAEPATRGAKKRFAEILAIRDAERAAVEAEIAARPKEPAMCTIFTPATEAMRLGRASLNTFKGSGHV